MALNSRSYRLGPLAIAICCFAANAGAQTIPQGLDGRLYGPGGVYAKIPARDEFGRDQLAMFREWNPDPVGNNEANLRALNPALARVIAKAQADNPELPFVIGSGLRDPQLQAKAVAWGWSRTVVARIGQATPSTCGPSMASAASTSTRGRKSGSARP